MGTFGVDSPIGVLLDNPRTRAVLQKHVPALLKHPLVSAARGMRLRDVLPFARGTVSEKTIASVLAELAAI